MDVRGRVCRPGGVGAGGEGAVRRRRRRPSSSSQAAPAPPGAHRADLPDHADLAVGGRAGRAGTRRPRRRRWVTCSSATWAAASRSGTAGSWRLYQVRAQGGEALGREPPGDLLGRLVVAGRGGGWTDHPAVAARRAPAWRSTPPPARRRRPECGIVWARMASFMGFLPGWGGRVAGTGRAGPCRRAGRASAARSPAACPR